MLDICNLCSFKCQVCSSLNQCQKCQPGYDLFKTADGRFICTKQCKTLWVMDKNGYSYLQGFYKLKGKCISCMKGCLNCENETQCFECGNKKTGITIQESQKCSQLVQNSCPIGTGYEQRAKRCFDCSFSSQKFYNLNSSLPKFTDSQICNTRDLYSAMSCTQSTLIKGNCYTYIQNIPVGFDLNKFILDAQEGCVSVNLNSPDTYSTCLKCSTFYESLKLDTFSPTYKCLSKSNGGLGNCEYKSNGICSDTCSFNDINIGEKQKNPYDPFDKNRDDLDDQLYNDTQNICHLKQVIRQRYSYNIDKDLCIKSLFGVFFEQEDGKQVCLTNCPSKIDANGQIIQNYYTQLPIVSQNINSNDLIGNASCVKVCSPGFAVDEKNKFCYQCSTDQFCLRCSLTNLKVCIECQQGYYLTDAGKCEKNCSVNSFVTDNKLYCLVCQIPNCISCLSTNQCQLCLNNALPESNCTVCKEGYFKHWKNQDQCVICDTSLAEFYVDQNGVCCERCGKGSRYTDELQCDDGNLENGDGCNQYCKIEKKWKCFGGNEQSQDTCLKIVAEEIREQNIDPNFTFSIQFHDSKNDSQPKVEILFSKQPILKEGVQMKQIFQLRVSSLTVNDFQYEIVPIQNDKIKSRRQLENNYGFQANLNFTSNIRNQEVMVIVDQNFITNSDGQIMLKNSAITPIKRYDFITEQQKSEIQKTNTIANSAQGVVIFAGLSVSVVTNFYQLMSIVDITEIIYYFLYLDIDYPKNVSSFFQQFDNFQLPFLPNPFDPIIEDIHQNCHSHVYTLDTDSLFLRNAGTNLFAVALFIGLFIFMKFLQIGFEKFTKFERLKKFLNICVFKLQYSFSLDIFYVVFLNIAASSFLQFQDTSIRQKNEKAKHALIFNMIFFSIVFAFIFIFPLYLFIKIWKNKKIIENQTSHEQLDQTQREQAKDIEQIASERIENEKLHKEFITKWEVLFTGCKQTHFNLYIYNVVTYYRKIFLVAIIMLMMDYAEIQILLLVIQNVCVAIYITKYMPFEKFAQNIINVISEILFILLEVFIMRLSSTSVNQEDEEERRRIGIWIISLILGIIGIHLLLMIYEMIHAIYAFALKKFKKRTSKVFSTVHIIQKQNSKGIYYNDAQPSINNSLVTTKKNKNDKNPNIKLQDIENNAKITSLQEIKLTQETRNIQPIDSFAFSSRSPIVKDSNNMLSKNDTFLQKINNKQDTKNSKENIHLSDDGNNFPKKSSSDDDEFDSKVTPKNPTSLTLINPISSLPMYSYRRRSTKTQDQTPFNLKRKRQSQLFRKDLFSGSMISEQIVSNLKIPSLQEVHEDSNSPTHSNDNISSRNVFPNSLSNLQSGKNTPRLEEGDKSKNYPDETPLYKNIRQKNLSRFSVTNFKSDNQLIMDIDEKQIS